MEHSYANADPRPYECTCTKCIASLTLECFPPGNLAISLILLTVFLVARFITVDPGDTIYFPDRWWHATINLDPYTAFVSTFTTEHNIDLNDEL
jgi:oxalate decarboxylase/phosphoglucose isomerase-like protein (cupin superfamily)